MKTKKHMIIPDIHIKPEQRLDFLRVIGTYIVEKQPDVIICLGDFADMESLSSYDIGKKSFEGRRYINDVAVTVAAMTELLAPINEYNKRAATNRKKLYKYRLVMCLGNHEDRINRVTENDPKLDGTISINDLKYEQFGWEVYPYKQVVIIDGIAYTHVFTTGVMQRPVTSARALLQKKHMSCIQGHCQKMEIYNEYKADSTMLTGLFAGCCYQHDENYLGPQGNDYFRGIHMLYDVKEGQFHCHSITLDYLLDRYKRRVLRRKVV